MRLTGAAQSGDDAPMTALFQIREVSWATARDSLRAIRKTVFVEEQGVPEALEWDEHDGEAQHVLAITNGGAPVGTGRLLRDGRIGRMAVLKAWRRHGVGSAMLDALIAMARRNRCSIIWLHAQVHALAFYERHGFEARGPEFSEAGIPHREMRLNPPRGAEEAQRRG